MQLHLLICCSPWSDVNYCKKYFTEIITTQSPFEEQHKAAHNEIRSSDSVVVCELVWSLWVSCRSWYWRFASPWGLQYAHKKRRQCSNALHWYFGRWHWVWQQCETWHSDQVCPWNRTSHQRVGSRLTWHVRWWKKKTDRTAQSWVWETRSPSKNTWWFYVDIWSGVNEYWWKKRTVNSLYSAISEDKI